MTKKSFETDVFNDLLGSFRDLISIPSKKDMELLNEKLDRIEKLLLGAVPAAPAGPAAPAAPAAPVEPVEPVNPIAQSESVEPVQIPDQPEKVTTDKETSTPEKLREASSDKVLEAIVNCRKGADFKKIKAATNFEDKKIRNIIFRLNKLGRIKKVKRGVYKAV